LVPLVPTAPSAPFDPSFEQLVIKSVAHKSSIEQFFKFIKYI
jgi:hypothetical protein